MLWRQPQSRIRIFEVSSPCWTTLDFICDCVLISYYLGCSMQKSKDLKGRLCCDMGLLSGVGTQRCLPAIHHPTSHAPKGSERRSSATARQVIWKLNLHLHRGSFLSTEPDLLLSTGYSRCELVAFWLKRQVSKDSRWDDTVHPRWVAASCTLTMHVESHFFFLLSQYRSLWFCLGLVWDLRVSCKDWK